MKAETVNKLKRKLLAELQDDGLFSSRLSSGALSTAVAAFALKQATGETNKQAYQWISDHCNEDGGWGDTWNSPSNFPTTLLVYAALANEPGFSTQAESAKQWLLTRIPDLTQETIKKKVFSIYDPDYTFSIPILTMCAISGIFGDSKEVWKRIPQLPFELSVFPQSLFRFLNLPVVSYALPALISMGLCRYKNYPGFGFWRRFAVSGALKRLDMVQPENGGFLEAAPLTGFVLMCLANSGLGNLKVTRLSISYLESEQRSDGSWPIDTALRIWTTIQAVQALEDDDLSEVQKKSIKQALLQQQTKQHHSFTGAEPGGWGWTDSAGSVPDADDTSGALILLQELGCPDEVLRNGVDWLMSRQNRDGGIATFCRGWGRFAFDCSNPDITAHALIAAANLADSTRLEKLKTFLINTQSEDGYWVPLWFGNQHVEKIQNPVYGTARVCLALQEVKTLTGNLQKGVTWLRNQQNSDGGWGGGFGSPSSVEETGLTLAALADDPDTDDAIIMAGLDFLEQNLFKLPPAPIGLYFSSLWYYEEIYPLTFAMLAISRLKNHRPNLLSED